LGRVDYQQAWELQRDLVRRRASGEIADTLLLLEHPPVYTTGRRGPGSNLRLPARLLGAPLVQTDRGGDITFHGPGQLVGYPITDLRAAGLSIVSYVRRLEDVLLRTLASYGIRAGTECGLTGVWVGRNKIAAIGVRVSRPLGPASGWITSHGFALNVNVDTAWFDRIVPCGIPDRGVTTMARLLGRSPSLEEVAAETARQFGKVYDRLMVEDSVSEPAVKTAIST
jgi:lipoate-protein ligase B